MKNVHRVLTVFPTDWDRKQLAADPQVRDRYEIIYAEPNDVDCPWNFDVLGHIEELVANYRGRIDGVFSSSDYPGATVAAAVATRLGLPGSRPDAIIRASHKYHSRLVQREAAPEATPWFEAVDPRDPAASLAKIAFPCFIKPVKGAFSIMSRRLDDAPTLIDYVSSAEVREFVENYLDMFDRLVGALTELPGGARMFVAEELLRGVQVTVEGFVTAGRVEILGIVDSVMHSQAPSFARFEYPSGLPESVQHRMADIVRRTIARLGLAEVMFNVELIYDTESDRIAIIEINPRICGQFADLYRKVDGIGGYEIALALAVGKPIQMRRQSGPFRVAASLAWRVFQPTRVVRVPDAQQLDRLEAEIPGLLVWNECAAGDWLADFQDEDGSSFRYAVVNLGSDGWPGLVGLEDVVRQRLAFELAPQ